MKIYKKLAGQTIIYGMGTVVPRLLNYAILTFYYTRLFTVEQFGVITELYAYVTFLMVILTFGTETGFFKFATDENKDTVFSTIATFLFTTSALFIVFIFSFQSEIAVAMEYSGNKEFIGLLSAIVAIDAFSSIGFAKLRLEENGIKFSALKIINVIVTIFFVLFFYEWMPKIISRNPYSFFVNLRSDVTYVLLSNLFASFIVLLLLIPEYIRINFNFRGRLLGEILKYSLPLLVSGLAGIVNETLDRILLRHLIHNSNDAIYALGIYGANYKIAVLLLIFIQMFRFAIEPFYFNYYKNKDYKEVYAQIMRLFISVMVILCMIIMFYLDYIKYFIDAKFHEGLRIVPIILVSYIFYGIFFNLSIWYKLTKRTIYAMILTSVGAFITIIINILFVPKYSYLASAYGHLISYSIMMIMSYFMGKKYLKINYQLGRIMEYVLVAIAIFALLNFIRHSLIKDIICGITIIAYSLYIAKREKLLKKVILFK